MFETYNSIKEIPVSNKVGYLYIFNATYYDRKTEQIINNIIKVGMTRGTIIRRLSQYTFNPKNISFICCSMPSKRESIIKYYIKRKLNIKPLYGTEYFNDDNINEIEKIMLFIGLCKDETINKYYQMYETKEGKKMIYYMSDELHPSLTKDINLCLDISQKRFDTIVEKNFTYDVYKNQEIVDEVIMKFFLNEEGVNVATLVDKRYMILRILDKDTGNYVYNTPEDIQNICKNSIPMMEKMRDYEIKILLEYNTYRNEVSEGLKNH